MMQQFMPWGHHFGWLHHLEKGVEEQDLDRSYSCWILQSVKARRGFQNKRYPACFFLIFHKVPFKRDVLWQLWDIGLDNHGSLEKYGILMTYLLTFSGSIKNSAALSCDPGEVGKVAACPHSCRWNSEASTFDSPVFSLEAMPMVKPFMSFHVNPGLINP